MEMGKETRRSFQQHKEYINRRTLFGSLCERPRKHSDNRGKYNRSWNSCPISTTLEDELNLHTDGELISGETKENITTTEKQKTRRSGGESKQPNRYGG